MGLPRSEDAGIRDQRRAQGAEGHRGRCRSTLGITEDEAVQEEVNKASTNNTTSVSKTGWSRRRPIPHRPASRIAPQGRYARSAVRATTPTFNVTRRPRHNSPRRRTAQNAADHVAAIAAAVILGPRLLGNKSEYFSHVPVYVDVVNAIKRVSRISSNADNDSDTDNDGRGSDDDVNTAAPFAIDDEEQVASAAVGVDTEGHLEALALPDENCALRGRALRHMDLYVYMATVLVVQRKDVQHDREVRASGRKLNATFDFDASHPNFMTHTQRLKARHHVPVILGRVPLLPRFEKHSQYTRAQETWPSSMKQMFRNFLSLC